MSERTERIKGRWRKRKKQTERRRRKRAFEKKVSELNTRGDEIIETAEKNAREKADIIILLGSRQRNRY